MRHLLITAFTLIALAGTARAQDYSINTIVGYVDLAEKRLNEGDAASARSNLESARGMLPGASAEAKADKRYAESQARIAKLDKLIAAKEQAAATVAQGDEKLEEADKNEIWARSAAESDDYDKAVEYYKACSASLDQAAAVDPTVKQRTSRGHHPFAELVALCKDGAQKMAKEASGEGRSPADTDEGKAALAGYQAAMKVATSKKPTTLEMSAAIRGAEACKINASALTSIVLRNGKHMWEGSKYKLGDLTLDDMWKKCDKLAHELVSKPAYGCGKHYVSVSQWRASVYDRWGGVQASGKMPFEAAECSDMPKQSKLPGLSASYKAKYVASCGADAVYVVIHNTWLESGTQRQMSGECWKKGTLSINK